jgi:hypothetical protein
MEQNNVNVQMDISNRDAQPIRATLAGQEGMKSPRITFDAETEARELLRIMGISGVLPIDTVSELLGKQAILDAEVIENGEADVQQQLESGNG